MQIFEALLHSNLIEKEPSGQALVDSLKAWNYIKHEKEITVTTLLNVHALVMKTRETIENTEKGAFRTVPVWVGGREGASWLSIQTRIDTWLKKVNAPDKNTPLWARDCHIEFEQIHPFLDGNGRTGRMIMYWQQSKFGTGIIPVTIDHVKEYYKWFNQE